LAPALGCHLVLSREIFHSKGLTNCLGVFRQPQRAEANFWQHPAQPIIPPDLAHSAAQVR
jgi:hypothetical protein